MRNAMLLIYKINQEKSQSTIRKKRKDVAGVVKSFDR